MTEFHLRPLRLSDIPALARYSVAAWADTPTTQFLTPRAALYPSDMENIYKRVVRNRLLNPASLSVVACLSASPNTTIGYGQFERIGGPSPSVFARFTYTLLSYAFSLYDKVLEVFCPDRVTDWEALRNLREWDAVDDEVYWKNPQHPERENRWHCESLIVDPKWQRKGVGRLIISKVTDMADDEGIIMGLIASPPGERLYRKMGFEMLGDFSQRIPGSEGGGIMIRYPRGRSE